MCYSFWATALVTSWLALCATTAAEAAPVRLVNMTTNGVLWASNDLGRVVVPAGVSAEWEASGDVAYGSDGGSSSSVSIGAGSSVYVYLSEAGAYAVDRMSWATYWFWVGLTLGFVLEFGGLGARWVRNIIGGGNYNE